jgi:hypothetical protein
MPATTALADCQRLVTAVSEAGGAVPDALGNILAAAALLKAHSAPPDPAGAIVDAAVHGQLTEKSLDAMLLDYATAVAANTHRGELRQRSETLFTEQFHRSLRDGCCDAILDSLRPSYDTAAEAIAAARNVIPADQPAEEFLRSAKPVAVGVWQKLDGHIAALDAVGRVAASFGPRTGNFPLIAEYALGDGFRLDDRALWCCNGPNLVADSAAFIRGTGTHRASP